jgi:DnaJ-class molecular chaperone
MSDLYERLGLEQGASHEEIRRAYKDLAREKHPDRGGDPEEFKKIQEAHEVLTDEGRRRMYDTTGSTQEGGAPMSGMAAGGFPFHFMGGAPRRPLAGRGPNKQHDIGLTLRDFYKGKEIKLKFNQARRCAGCKGSGAEKTEPCGQCSGTGSKTMVRAIGPGIMAQTRVPCDGCGGEGKRVIRACGVCHGKRFVEREKQLDIRIVPGMRDGENLVFEGECSDSPDFERPGDVVLTLRRTDAGVSYIDEFEWEGDDLCIRKQITFAESILGFSRVLSNHPGGEKTVIWRGGPLIHGAVLQIAGGGMPRRGGTGHGALRVQVLVQPPETKPWTPEEVAKLQSVLGGASIGLDAETGEVLTLSSAESKVVFDHS